MELFMELQKEHGQGTYCTEPRKIVSSDLTAATDLLPLDLVRVVWEELLEALNTPEWAREVVYSCIGP